MNNYMIAKCFGYCGDNFGVRQWHIGIGMLAGQCRTAWVQCHGVWNVERCVFFYARACILNCD